MLPPLHPNQQSPIPPSNFTNLFVGQLPSSHQQQNPILNIQTHIKSLNQCVESRIATLRNKIDKLKAELLELDKLNPALNQLNQHQQVKLGGKVLTQITIDAVQSPNQNVIKVNSIKKKFIGFIEPQPVVQAQIMQPQPPAIKQEPVKQEDPYAIGQLPMYLNSNKPESTPRQKYRMLATDLKRKAVTLAGEKGPRYSSLFYQVPLKSLKRWIKVGCERKKGGGRKTKDPAMERQLYKWYKNEVRDGRSVTARKVKDMAIKMSTCGDFIASKGWLDKFKVRYHLDIQKETNTTAQGQQSSAVSGVASNCKGEFESCSDESSISSGDESSSNDDEALLMMKAQQSDSEGTKRRKKPTDKLKSIVGSGTHQTVTSDDLIESDDNVCRASSGDDHNNYANDLVDSDDQQALQGQYAQAFPQASLNNSSRQFVLPKLQELH